MENRKQNIKLLILADLKDFEEKKILAKLDKLKRRYFDMVVIIGDVNKILLTEISLLFETALITTLPSSQYSQVTYDSLGVLDLNLRKQKIEDIEILGYGSRKFNPNPVHIDKLLKYEADILVSYHAPMRIHPKIGDFEKSVNVEEINKYGAFQKPKLLIHAGCKSNQETVLSNGTKIVSCYGICPFLLDFDSDNQIIDKE